MLRKMMTMIGVGDPMHRMRTGSERGWLQTTLWSHAWKLGIDASRLASRYTLVLSANPASSSRNCHHHGHRSREVVAAMVPELLAERG